jgi:hypothetical protein
MVSQMNTIDTERFLDFVETQQGKCLYTLARRAEYEVKVVNDGNGRWLKFFVRSTKKVKNHRRNTLDQVIERFNTRKSFKTSDYSDLTVNASYDLGLIKSYLPAE